MEGPANLLSDIMLGFHDRGHTREVGCLTSKRIERQPQFAHNTFHKLRHLSNLLNIGEFSVVDGCEATVREARTRRGGSIRPRGTLGVHNYC